MDEESYDTQNLEESQWSLCCGGHLKINKEGITHCTKKMLKNLKFHTCYDCKQATIISHKIGREERIERISKVLEKSK